MSKGRPASFTPTVAAHSSWSLSKAGELHSGFIGWLVWAIWGLLSFYRTVWNEGDFLMVCGWLPSPYSVSEHCPHSSPWLCALFNTCSSLYSLPLLGEFSFQLMKLKTVLLRTFQVKSFSICAALGSTGQKASEGQSCCFKLDFFLFVWSKDFIYSTSCPCIHRKLKTNLIGFSKIESHVYFMLKFEF